MRGQIEGLLHLRALDIYGLSEIIGPGVACESLDSEGMLNVAEDHFYVEALDVDGHPVADGTPGELVFSTLTKTGMPLLRYRTGDIATLAGPVEGSVRTLRRMSKLLGRRDDMLVVRGVNVFPTEIEAILLGDPRVSPHYLIVEDRRVASRPALRVAVEPASAGSRPADAGRRAHGGVAGSARRGLRRAGAHRRERAAHRGREGSPAGPVDRGRGTAARRLGRLKQHAPSARARPTDRKLTLDGVAQPVGVVDLDSLALDGHGRGAEGRSTPARTAHGSGWPSSSRCRST